MQQEDCSVPPWQQAPTHRQLAARDDPSTATVSPLQQQMTDGTLTLKKPCALFLTRMLDRVPNY